MYSTNIEELLMMCG